MITLYIAFYEFYTTVKLTQVISQQFDHKTRLNDTETIHTDKKHQRHVKTEYNCLEASLSSLETRNHFDPLLVASDIAVLF